MSFNDYRDPIIWEMRDTYIPITQEIPIDDYGRVIIDEVPDEFSGVTVTSTGKTWYEIKDGIPNDSQYKVDYNGNTIQFSVANKGLVVTIDYFGRGGKYISASSIYTSQNNGQIVETLQQIIERGQDGIDAMTEIAEFKHSGTYNPITQYYKNNIITYNGISYICIADSIGEQPDTSSKFAKLSGNKWMNVYSTTTTYGIGDYVIDSANENLYISISDNNLNNLLTDTTKWNLVLSISDIIQTANNAISSIQTTETNVQNAENLRVTAENNRNSAETTRQNQESTRQTNETNRETAESTRVSNENARISAENTRSTNETNRQSAESGRVTAENERESNESQRILNETDREIAIDNLSHKDEYNHATTYQPRNIVSYLGSSYMCILESIGNLPTNTTYWKKLASKGDKGAILTPRGLYDTNTTYEFGDLVTYDGSTYYALQSTTGNLPTDPIYWETFMSGGGDMTKLQYDTNNNGQVDKADDSDKLGGKLPSEYEGNIYKQSTEPTTPELNDLWIDTSTTPHTFKLYNGTTWNEIGTKLEINDTTTSTTSVWSSQKTSIEINNIIQEQNTLNENWQTPTGFINRTDSILSFDDVTRTFTISPTVNSFSVYSKGELITYNTPQSVQINDIEGNWYIYFDATGVLHTSQTSFLSDLSNVYISVIYWSFNQKKAIYFADERHGIQMDRVTHAYLHSTQGSKYKDGLIIGNYILSGDGSLDSDAQISISNGSFYDEDILHEITHSDTPTLPLEQELSPIAKMPIWYRVDGNQWQSTNKLNYPLNIGTSLPTYNKFDTTWSTIDTTSGNFIAMFVFVTNNIYAPIIAIMGQREDTTLEEAKSNNTFENLNLGEMPFQEFRALYRLIYQVDSSYTNTAKAKLVDVVDLRNISIQQVSSIATENHNTLSGRNNANSHPASAISYAPNINNSADDVQTAIDNNTNKISVLTGDIGDKTTLTTTEKGNLVGAVNEVKGDIGTHSNQNSTTSQKGHVQLATSAEVKTGIDNAKAVTSLGINEKMKELSTVTFKNLLKNGNFDQFTNISGVADDWTIALGDVLNTCGRDVLTYYSGGCSQYITKHSTKVGTTIGHYQEITNPDVINYLKGKTISLRVAMYSNNTGQYAMIQCRGSDDLTVSGGQANTELHQGGGKWQILSCKIVVPINTVKLRIYTAYYPSDTGTGSIYIDSAVLQVGEVAIGTPEIEYQSDKTENVTTIPITTNATNDSDKRVIYSVTLRGLKPSDKVFLFGQFEVTNPQTYTIGVGKYIVRTTDATTVTGTYIHPSTPNMENITVDIHHKVFQLMGFDTSHSGGTVTYNVVGYAAASTAQAGHTCTVEQGYGALYALIL